jgi:hypothetical protein
MIAGHRHDYVMRLCRTIVEPLPDFYLPESEARCSQKQKQGCEQDGDTSLATPSSHDSSLQGLSRLPEADCSLVSLILLAPAVAQPHVARTSVRFDPAASLCGIRAPSGARMLALFAKQTSSFPNAKLLDWGCVSNVSD